MKNKIKFKEKSFKKKVIDFGNVYACIKEINYREFTKNTASITIVIETLEDETFEGITTKNGKKYNGAVGFIRISKYPVKLDKEVSIDFTIRKLRAIATAVGVEKDFLSLNGKCETLECFVSEFKKLNIYDKYVYWCIGGSYKGKTDNGYDRYDPFLVEFKKDSKLLPVSNIEEDVIVFDKQEHIDTYYIDKVSTNKNNNNITLPEFLDDNNNNNNKTEDIIDNNDNDNDNFSDDLPF